MFKSISNINIYIRQLTLNELQSPVKYIKHEMIEYCRFKLGV